MLFYFKNLRIFFISLLLISCGGENSNSNQTSTEPILEPLPPVVTILPVMNQVTILTQTIEQYKKSRN